MAAVRTKAPASALQAGASDSEDDLATAAEHPIRAAERVENKRAKSTGNKSKTTKLAKPQGARETKMATKRKAAAPKQSRPALKDRTNLQQESDAEEVETYEDEDVGIEEEKPKAKKAKTAGGSRSKDTSDAPARSSGAAKKARTTKRAPQPASLSMIPESGNDTAQTEEVEQSIEIDPNPVAFAPIPSPKPVARFAQRAPSASIQPLQPRASARSASVQPGYPPVRERSGSVSGTERRGGDPELRRQLNDLTKKHENLQFKYETLQELGKNDAETNFEKLKRASDQKAKDTNELIASLKKELADLRKSSSATTSETTTLQTQVTTLTASNEKFTAERDDLKTKLQVSQNETKALEAKLVTARQQLSNSVQELKAHESAATTSKSSSARHAATAEVQREKENQMKENLYSDLTGLIIRSVKRKEGEDKYDCIQTGRNGSKSLNFIPSSQEPTFHK